MPASGYQLSTIHYQLSLAARVGLAPTPNGLTGRRATLTLPGNRSFSYGSDVVGGAGPQFAKRTSIPGASILWRNWEFKCSSRHFRRVFCDTRFTGWPPEHLPDWLRGCESHLPKEVYEASLGALVEFPAMKWPAEPKLDRAKVGGVGG